MQSKNDDGVKVSVLVIARRLSRRESFKRGYDSVMRSQPYDYDISDKWEAINYARGRAFAVWSNVRGWKGCRWKDGVLSKAAEGRVVDALQQRAII
jgi:hypothetical protein